MSPLADAKATASLPGSTQLYLISSNYKMYKNEKRNQNKTVYSHVSPHARRMMMNEGIPIKSILLKAALKPASPDPET